MQPATVPRILGVACAIALWLVPSQVAAENDAMKPNLVLTREILAHMDDPPPEPGWIGRHLSLGGKGLKYRQPLSFGDRQLELKVSGPVMPRKSFGLSFEVRF